MFVSKHPLVFPLRELAPVSRPAPPPGFRRVRSPRPTELPEVHPVVESRERFAGHLGPEVGEGFPVTTRWRMHRRAGHTECTCSFRS